ARIGEPDDRWGELPDPIALLDPSVARWGDPDPLALGGRVCPTALLVADLHFLRASHEVDECRQCDVGRGLRPEHSQDAKDYGQRSSDCGGDGGCSDPTEPLTQERPQDTPSVHRESRYQVEQAQGQVDVQQLDQEVSELRSIENPSQTDHAQDGQGPND